MTLTTKLVFGWMCDCPAGFSDEEGHLIHHEPQHCEHRKQTLAIIPTDPDFVMPPWRNAEVTIFVEHPAPEVPGRRARPEEIPDPTRKLAKKAHAAGFEGNIFYARGVPLSKQSKTVKKLKEGEEPPAPRIPRVEDSILLNGMNGSGDRFAAVWRCTGGHVAACPDGCDRKHYSSVLARVWPAGGSRQAVSFEELKRWITSHGTTGGC